MAKTLPIIAAILALAAVAEPSQAGEIRYQWFSETERVVASWYGGRYHGRPTASGETFDRRAMTAAHPTLPFGTLVEVVYPARGASVVVRINDRGPSPSSGRGIDLSEAAARSLGLLAAGVDEVLVYPLPEVAAWQ